MSGASNGVVNVFEEQVLTAAVARGEGVSFLPIQAVAEHYGVPAFDVRTRLRLGDIPGLQFGGRYVSVLLSWVEATPAWPYAPIYRPPSREERLRLAEAQGGRCRICRRKKRLVPDHDHERRVLRAMLCVACNTALGKFGDDPWRLRAAADYVEEHRQPQEPPKRQAAP